MEFIRKSPKLFILTLLLSLIPIFTSFYITLKTIGSEEMVQFFFFMLELFLVPVSFVISTVILVNVLSRQEKKVLSVYPYMKLMTGLSVLGVLITILYNLITHFER
jgi:hypothetical protein